MFLVINTRRLAAVLLVGLVLCAASSTAQNNNRSDKPISEDHYKILQEKSELIEKDIALNQNEWEGVYEQGDHHPTIFEWSANQGFLTWGSHHTFFPSRINFGKAEFSNNRLIIKPEITKQHLNFQYIPTELFAIKWGSNIF